MISLKNKKVQSFTPLKNNRSILSTHLEDHYDKNLNYKNKRTFANKKSLRFRDMSCIKKEEGYRNNMK